MLTAIAFSWFLSLGYVPVLENRVDAVGAAIESQRIATVAEIGLSANYSCLNISASIENYQYMTQGIYFEPFRADYKIGASIQVSKNCSIDITHECDHPVMSSYQKKDSVFLSKETQVRFTIKGGSK